MQFTYKILNTVKLWIYQGLAIMSNTKFSQERSRCYDVLRGFARNTGVKVAEIGGNKDMSFEQALSNLAHTYLKEKAPGLLDYEVGFQLVERNQENTKAIGAFGFKVGSQWLLGPVFFLNGDLKGHELLYLKSQDLFVPMKENWLNYILNRKPSILGEEVTRDSARLGVSAPNLYQLSRSPYKFAAAAEYPDWFKETFPALAHAAVTPLKNCVKYSSMVDVPTFIKKEGRAAAINALIAFKQYPKLAAKFDEFYGMDIFNDVLSSIKEAEDKKESRSVLNVPVIKMSSVIEREPEEKLLKIAVKIDMEQPMGDEISSMSSDEKCKLMQEGVYIKDKRMNVSKAYNVQTEMKMTNPTETGIYEVLTSPGKFEKCLIVMDPHAASCRKNFATIIRLDGERNWLSTHGTYVWVNSELNPEKYRKWYDEQKDVKTLPIDKSGLYVIIGEHGQGTLPFKVKKSIGEGNGVHSYDVDFKRGVSRARPDHLPNDSVPLSAFDDYHYEDGERIILTGRPGRFATSRGELRIPTGCKLIKCKSFPKAKDRPGSDGGYDNEKYDEYSSKTPAIQLGSIQDIQLLCMQKTAGMKIYHSGTEVSINGSAMSPMQGLIHLVRNHGLREKEARVMLQEAEKNKVARYRIKYADEYNEMQHSGPTAPPWPDQPSGWDPLTGGRANTKTTLEANLPIPDMSANKTDRSVYQPNNVNQQPYADMQVQQVAQQAAQSGQKEVFDTSMIASLIKATRDDSMVDRWLPDLMKGMDRIGRVLMIFYWHQESFSERYGKSELPELEDGLRNAFEALGDIILTLRQKTIDPYPDDVGGSDLGAVADM